MSQNRVPVVRNLRFQLDASIPRHWYGGQPATTAFIDSQSLFFPAGERFFVDAVKSAIPRVNDPELAQRARAFCGQEGIHTREHVRYNRMLQARGYPATRLERWVKHFLSFVRLITLPRQRLAITCALEHLTAIGAARGLSAGAFQGADPRMRAFWRWHGAEELEHKSIPFDIYQAVGGFYLERISIMVVTTIVFRTYALLHLLCFMWIDGVLFSRRAYGELSSALRAMGGSRAFLRDYLSYYRRGFHPSQLDDSRALESFRSEMPASPIYAAAASERAIESIVLA